jgi:hypothetical protein
MNYANILHPSSIPLSTTLFIKHYICSMDVLFVFRFDVSEASVFVFVNVSCIIPVTSLTVACYGTLRVKKRWKYRTLVSLIHIFILLVFNDHISSSETTRLKYT